MKPRASQPMAPQSSQPRANQPIRQIPAQSLSFNNKGLLKRIRAILSPRLLQVKTNTYSCFYFLPLAPNLHEFMRADVLVKALKNLGHVNSGSSTEQWVTPHSRMATYKKLRSMWPELLLDLLASQDDEDLKKRMQGGTFFAQDLRALSEDGNHDVKWIVPIWPETSRKKELVAAGRKVKKACACAHTHTHTHCHTHTHTN